MVLPGHVYFTSFPTKPLADSGGAHRVAAERSTI